MSDMTDDGMKRRFPWARAGFDIEGWVGAGACLIVGFLLGLIWSGLFFIGLVGAVVILAATRRARPVAPQDDGAVVSPVDGILHAVSFTEPPPELGMGNAAVMCVRIASPPWSSNPIQSPVTGNVSAAHHHAGRQGQVFAVDPDDDGLEWSCVAVESGGWTVGLKAIVGAFGPRMELDVEVGDVVRMGRPIGKRRLGGWCDVWLPAGVTLNVLPGQTLVGGETILSFVSTDTDRSAQTPQPPAESVSLETVGEVIAADAAGQAAPVSDRAGTPLDKPVERSVDKPVKRPVEKPVDAAEPQQQTETDPAGTSAASATGSAEPHQPGIPADEETLDEETAALFARLRREVGARGQEDGED